MDSKRGVSDDTTREATIRLMGVVCAEVSAVRMNIGNRRFWNGRVGTREGKRL
jgi:hypothetical protein